MPHGNAGSLRTNETAENDESPDDALHATNQAILARRMSERELMEAVIECAERLGWIVAHIPDRLYAMAHREGLAHITGGAQGLPDLVMAKDGRVILAELKSHVGGIRLSQARWIAAAGDACYLWRPEQWLDGTIERTLRDEEATR